MAKILILDDDYELSATWRNALEAKGHIVSLSSTSSEAIAYATADEYDVFVVDFLLSNKQDTSDGGRLLLVHLKQTMSASDIEDTVIGVSGVDVATRTRAAQTVFESLGATTFLAKPFTPETLVEVAEGMIYR